MPSTNNRARTPLEKPMPNNLDAERAILGAVLLDNSALKVVLHDLSSADFFLDQHKRILRHMIRLAEAGEAIDLITLTNSLHRDGELEAAGGPAYPSSLADGMPKVTNVRHYAKIVKDLAVRRNLIHQCHAIQERAWEGEESSQALVTRARSEEHTSELQSPVHLVCR